MTLPYHISDSREVFDEVRALVEARTRRLQSLLKFDLAKEEREEFEAELGRLMYWLDHQKG